VTSAEPNAGLVEALGSAILDGAPTEDPLGLVRRVADAEDSVRHLLHQSVGAARAAGHSWAAIGAELGMSRQAVQQRFGERTSATADPLTEEQRWLGPVTAFDEMGELEIAGRLGWHTVRAGMLRHLMVRTSTQWEHKRVVWTGSLGRYEKVGWVVGCRAFPWVYLVRDTGLPVESGAPKTVREPRKGSPA
jgi:hypothetical protein